MSDATHDADHDTHEGLIRTPKQLIVAVVAAFVVPVVVIIMLANYVASNSKSGAGSEAMTAESVARRVQPVGTVQFRDASAPAAPRTGEQVVQAQCGACHATGVAGAPKIGDAVAWGPRLAAGFDALLNSALKGKNAMPPQAGAAASEFEIARAVVYMANLGGGKFAEPKAPEAAASGAAPATAAASAAAK